MLALGNSCLSVYLGVFFNRKRTHALKRGNITGFVRPRENPGISFDPGKTLENPGISSRYPWKHGNFIYLIFVYIFDHAEWCMKCETLCAKPHCVGRRFCLSHTRLVYSVAASQYVTKNAHACLLIRLNWVSRNPDAIYWNDTTHFPIYFL